MFSPGPPAQPLSEDEGPFEQILLLCLQRILEDEQPTRFLRWAQDALTPILNREQPDLGPGEDRRLAFLLARAIWNATPLPGQGFRPQPLNAPDDAMPCPCGSRALYGQCCGAIRDAPEMPPDLLWELLLAELGEPLFKQALASGEVPPHLLGLAAERWLMEDKPGRAIALLEPLFDGPTATRLDERCEQALNILCDAYDRRDHWKKKRAFLDRMRAHPCRGLRAAAWQRLCTIHIDEGAFAEAQLAFSQTQREAPDNPGTALLEIALLATQHEDGLARDRALFWRHKLRRSGEEDAGILDFLEQAGRDPLDALMTSQSTIIDHRLMDLRDWARASTQRPTPVYDLEPAILETRDEKHPATTPVLERDAAGYPDPAPEPRHQMRLLPPRDLAALEAQWHALFPAPKPLGPQLLPIATSPNPWEEKEEEGWLAFLDRHPAAADSLDILDDLVTAIYVHPDSALPWIARALLVPLLERAQSIAARVLPDEDPRTLPWDRADNRPALRLLFRLYLAQTEAGQEEAAVTSLHRLMRLNPRDHHGIRADLMNDYLRQGEDVEALALARRFPNDRLVDLAYGEVLALFRQGSSRQAQQALHRAQSHLPLIPRYLTQKRVARPRLREPGPSPGSAETAWFYRESMLDVWEAEPGLLEWLRRQAG
ncbi:MAG: SEC-C domain-containing protein [Chromatiaceae bacterium]|nr:SEC-C domain-containing protein [Chromatiaceae bacterium]